MAESNSAAPAVNSEIESGKFEDEKEIKSDPPKAKVEEEEEEDENIVSHDLSELPPSSFRVVRVQLAQKTRRGARLLTWGPSRRTH